MSVLIIDPLYNTPGEHDDDGAFEPAADKLSKLFSRYGTAVRWSFDNSKPSLVRVNALLDHLSPTAPDVDTFIHVGHGYHAGTQVGMSIPFVPAVFKRLPNCKRVILFSCSCASPLIQTSIARVIADQPGVEDVLAHDCEGHTTWNPHLWHLRKTGAHRICSARTGSDDWRAWVHFCRYMYGDLALIFAGRETETSLERNAEGFFTWRDR